MKLSQEIVTYVAKFHHVTANQVAWKTRVYKRKGTTYAYVLLRKLRKQGFLVIEDIEFNGGHVLSLTASGWRAAGREPPSLGPQKRSYGYKLTRVQLADAMLELGLLGWQLVEGQAVEPILRKWALQNSVMARHREGAFFRQRLLNQELDTTNLAVLHREQSGELRLVYQVQPGVARNRWTRGFPAMYMFPELTVEVICPQLTQADEGMRYLRRWAKRYKHRYTVRAAPNFRTRPNAQNSSTKELIDWLREHPENVSRVD